METTRAWVHCGARQLAYARAGSGPTLVLLTEWSSELPLPKLFEELSASFRVILPELAGVPRCPDAKGCGVGDLLDTLGLHSASLVADPSYAAEALQLALAEPERIERVVMLSSSGLAGSVVPRVEVLHIHEQPTRAQLNALRVFLGGAQVIDA